MKIHTAQSARFFGAQIDRIETGFQRLGHEITPYVSDADLIYQNNPWFDTVLADRERGVLKPGSKVIFNVLDVPLHIPDYDIGKLTRQLKAADAVTAISQWTADQVREKCGIEAHVVYNPIKSVSRSLSLRKTNFPRFASIGRRSDSNKFCALWVRALSILGYEASDVVLVGNEPGWGEYCGVLRDHDLNVVYNSVDFVLATGRVEGLNLPVIEAMATGAIPIVANHLTTLEEIFPAALFPEYHAIEPTPRQIAQFIASLTNDESGARMAEMKLRLLAHYATHWQERTSPEGVARRILNVYQSLP